MNKPEDSLDPNTPVVHPALRPLKDRGLFWVMSLALLTRFIACLLCWNVPDALTAPNTSDYLRLARNIETHFEYCEGVKAVSPAIEYPPLFPFFLVFEDYALGHSLNTLALAQALLGMLACAVIYAAAFAMIGARGALVAGLLAAFDPVCAAGSLLTSHEGLYFLFLTLAVWALAQAFIHDYGWAWVAGGAAAALAALTWSDALWLPALVVAGCLIQRRPHPQTGSLAGRMFHGRGKRLAAFIGIFIIITGVWFARNYWVTNQWGFATEPGRRWLENRHAGVLMMKNGMTRAEAVAKLDAEFKTRHAGEPLPGFAPASAWRMEAVGALVRSPLTGLRLWIRGAWLALSEPELDVTKTVIRIIFPQTRIGQTLEAVYEGVARALQWALLAFIIAGGIHHRSWRGGFAWWGPVAYLIYFLPFLCDIKADAGLRLPMAPALYLLAAREIELYWPWAERRLFGNNHYGFTRVIHKGPVIQTNGGPRL